MAFFLLIMLCLILLYVYNCKSKQSHTHHSSSVSLFRTHNLPKSYSLIRLILVGDEGRHNYMSRMLSASPSSTVILHLFLGGGSFLFTANPDNIRHILRTQFSTYTKDHRNISTFGELFGRSLINIDGDEWRSLRQLFSHRFTKGYVRSAVESVVEPCILNCLIPSLSNSSKNGHVVDLQDVLQRFNFDTTCKMAFGFDPKCLSQGSDDGFFEAYKQAVSMSSKRNKSVFPFSMGWKIEKLLNIGSQKRLMEFVRKIRAYALAIVDQKKDKLKLGLMGANVNNNDDDFLSRLLQDCNDDGLVIDLITNFILGGSETVSSALTWFFWLVSRNPEVEDEIVREIHDNEGKDMVYTHAALCESMRLYPPIPEDSRDAANDDVLPDGTHVRKGMRIIYSIYSMGRSERIWGSDWTEFKPKRWLQWDDKSDTWSFVPRDPYTYTVFGAGPRMCLGRELAFLQMKILVARFLVKFKVVPCKNEEAACVADITSKIKGGFPVRLEERNCI